MDNKLEEKYKHKKDIQSVFDLVDHLVKQKEIDVEKNWNQLHMRMYNHKNKNRLLIWFRNIAATRWRN